MEELYWITRTNAVLIIAAVLLAVALFMLLLLFGYLNTIYDRDEINATIKFIKKYVWIDFTVIIVCSLLLVFVPSRKDMLIIFGVGGAIEYVKNNEKARQLPDKVVDAIDAYLESLKDDKE